MSHVHLWAVDLAAWREAGVAPVPDAGALGTQSEFPTVFPPTEPTPRERERAGRFRSSSDAARYLAAHGALRQVLASYLRCPPWDVPIATAERGKPFLAGNELSFNLSHSGSIALIAVARGRQVGVDVERHRPIGELEAIVARIATPRERDALLALPPQERDRGFFELWTRKEALAKMTGEGIAAIGVDAAAADDVDYRLVQLLDLSGYSACVAAEGRGWELVRCT